MRILVLTNLFPPDFTGGYELGCRQAVAALRARGHAIRVLTSTPRLPTARVPDIERSLHLTDMSNPFCIARSPQPLREAHEAAGNFVNAANVHVLVGALEEFRPDVCYVWNLLGLGGLGLMACLQYLQIPWVWHLMDAVPVTLCSRQRQPVPALGRLFEHHLEGEYLACSQRLVDEIAAGGIRLPGRVTIVPNWMTGQRPPPRQQFYRGGRLRIVSAGQIGTHKGVDLIIEAAGRLRQAGHTDFSVDIYGKVTDVMFPQRIEALGLRGLVTLAGLRSQDELRALYAQHAYDVFAFPTWEREPFAFAPLEAAAYGCVPILSDSCGNADWFVHGLDCLKVMRTPEALAGCLAEILDGTIDVEAIGRRAAKGVWRDFHIDNMLPRMEAALARAAARPRRQQRSAADVYQMALLAEKLVQIAGKQPFAA